MLHTIPPDPQGGGPYRAQRPGNVPDPYFAVWSASNNFLKVRCFHQRLADQGGFASRCWQITAYASVISWNREVVSSLWWFLSG